ncbi:MAG: hypothetical protein ABIR68_09495 [Ilumatobacteraceae bacterium]
MTAALSVMYVVVEPASVDFASGDFRARLFREGSLVWNNAWFAGHPLPGYGLIPPMLGAWLGVIPLGVGSALLATWCLTLVVERCVAMRPTLADPTVTTVLLALGCSLNLWSGRLTFGPSIAFGAGCVLALQRRCNVVAVICAIGCGLSSPVGAVSLVIVLAGCWCAGVCSRRVVAVAAVAALVPISILGIAFPEGGWYPFTGRSMLLLGAALVIVGWLGRRERVILWTVVAYTLAAAFAFLVRTPLGGNIVRLGWLAAGPAAAIGLRRHRRVFVSFIAALSLVWGWSYAKMAFRSTDATATEQFYDSLAAYVNASPGGVHRVEVVPTETYRQADELALEINVARGWDTQLDRKYNPQLYARTLTNATFHRWLDDNAVGLVALPLGRLQHTAHLETTLIRAHPDYLQLAWANADWQVFRVVHGQPLATNGAIVQRVEPEALTIDATRTGTTTIKFRYSRLYRVTNGEACTTRAPGGWIDLHVARPGRITIRISLSAEALLGSTPTCR